MKIRKLLGGLILSTVLAAGVGIFAGSQNTSVEKANAETATTVYYAVDTTYTVKCNIHLGSNQGDPWATYDMTKVDGTYGIYKATFTDKWDGIATMQFQLYDGATQKDSREVISSWTSVSTYNNKLYYNGGWTTTFKEVKKSTSLSSSTGRVFFSNSGTHWANGGTCAVYAWGGDATKTIDSKITMEGTFYHFKWFADEVNENEHWYGYADIPLNVTGYKIAKLSNDNYVTSLSYDSTNTFNIDSFAYVRYGQESGNTLSTGGAKDDEAGPALMTKVVEAYDTCSASTLNGYGAYDALNLSFYSHASDEAKTTNVKSYNGDTTSVANHFAGMASRKASSGSGRLIIGAAAMNNLGTIIPVVLISAIAIAAVGGYFLFRKKKEN